MEERLSEDETEVKKLEDPPQWLLLVEKIAKENKLLNNLSLN